MNQISPILYDLWVMLGIICWAAVVASVIIASVLGLAFLVASLEPWRRWAEFCQHEADRYAGRQLRKEAHRLALQAEHTRVEGTSSW